MGNFRLDRRSLLLGAAAVAAMGGISACTTSGDGPTTSPSKGERRTSLVVGATLEPDSLDITAGTLAAVPQVLLYNVLETLVKIDSEGSLRPLLATAWTLSDDRLTLTFTLRNNTKFSSGTDVTADAVAKSLELNRASKVHGSDLEAISAVNATAEHTLELKLTQPSNFLLYNLAGRAGAILDPSSFESRATTPVGSGPYAFVDWQRGTAINLKRNDNYWGNPPKFETVSFRYFADPQALTNAMLTGDIDIISDVTAPDSLSQFSDTSKFTIIEGTTNGEVVMGFNHRTAALKNLKVRQAINHAIDRKALVDTVWGGKGTMIGSMVAPTDPWYEDLSNTYPYDPAKAKALLAESGVKNITLRMVVPALPYAPGSAQVVMSQLKEVGITVTVQQVDTTTWLDVVYRQHNYDLTVIAHVEPRDIVNWANKDYYWGYDNKAFQTLIADADKAPQDEQVAKLKEAGRVLADDAVADFLFLFPNLVVCKADLSGINENSTTLSFDVTNIASRNG